MPTASLYAWTVRKPAYFVWALFVLLGPLYVAPNGLPQPGDILIFLVVPLSLVGWDGRFDRMTTRTLKPLLWFTLWVFFVNYAWATVLGKFDRLKDFLIHPFFYLFNVAIFISALILARRNREPFLRLTMSVVYATIFIQVIASFVFRGGPERVTLFFNSPNQLGYYALLAACLFAMTQRPLGFSRLRSGIGVTCCAYLSILSASRAAMGGIAVLVFVLVFANPRTIILASVAAIALMTAGGPLANAIDNAQYRSQALSRHGTFAEERGYDRLWLFPQYLVTGAGEGEYGRFVRPGEQGRELHSSFGSVLFGYGVLGITLVGLFFARVLKGSTWRDAFMLIPALSFAIAHQGLRFTMFWIVLAVFVILKQQPREP